MRKNNSEARIGMHSIASLFGGILNGLIRISLSNDLNGARDVARYPNR